MSGFCDITLTNIENRCILTSSLSSKNPAEKKEINMCKSIVLVVVMVLLSAVLASGEEVALSLNSGAKAYAAESMLLMDIDVPVRIVAYEGSMIRIRSELPVQLEIT